MTKKEVVLCSDCEKDIGDIIGKNDFGHAICSACSENYFICNECENSSHNDDKCEDNNGNDICQNCFDENYFNCCGCGEALHNDNYEEDGYCVDCYNDDDGEGEIAFRECDFTNDEHQNKEIGKIITDSRKFGVELEMVNKSLAKLRDLSNKVRSGFGVERDGSVEMRNGYGIEVQTPPLSGKAGEKAILEICKTVEDLGFTTNETCGMHVHLDGEDFLQKADTLKTINVGKGIESFSEILTGDFDEKYLVVYHKNGLIPLRDFTYDFLVPREFNGVVYPETRITGSVFFDYTGIRAQKEAKKLFPVKGDLFPYFCTSDVLSKIDLPLEQINIVGFSKSREADYLRTLLYLFSCYDSVLVGMLPESRRQKNRYCKRISTAFSPEDIERCRTYEDIEELWFKVTDKDEREKRKKDHYDTSRYYGLNLHSLFGINKTIEIRLHSGTIDAEKVLNWVAINQHILSRITEKDSDLLLLSPDNFQNSLLVGGSDLFSHKDKLSYFLKIMRFPEKLEKYIKSRTRHFLKIKI